MIGLTCLFLIAVLAVCHGTACAQEEPPEIVAPEDTEIIAPVEQIAFAGNTALSDVTLLQAARIEPGEPLSAGLLTEAIRRIERLYEAAGYIADVTFYELRDVPPPRTLIFNIQEVVVSEVIITGLERTREETILELLEMQPGAVYNHFALQRDVSRLYGLNIFEEIRVGLEPGEQPAQVRMLMEVIEARTRRFDVSGSIAPEGRLIAQVQYTDLNLFGRAQQISVATNVGTVGGQIGANITYFDPLFGPPRASLFARGFSDVFFRFGETLVLDPPTGRYFERRTGVQATASYPLEVGQRIAYSARYENTGVDNLPIQLFVPGAPPEDASVVAASARYVDDQRVFMLLPVAGNYFSGLVEPGYVNFDNDNSGVIAKTQAEWRTYFPFWEIERLDPLAVTPSLVPGVAIRASAGTSAGELPFFEQYFVGGITNLRGYRESRFWGRHFFAVNTELRWPLSPNLMAVAFLDAGDAWGSDYQFAEGVETAFRQHRELSPRTGGGVGVWYLTAFGIVRLEYARGEIDRLHFWVGEVF